MLPTLYAFQRTPGSWQQDMDLGEERKEAGARARQMGKARVLVLDGRLGTLSTTLEVPALAFPTYPSL